MSEPVAESPELDGDDNEGSTLITALHVLMWTALGCGLIALMVVVLITR